MPIYAKSTRDLMIEYASSHSPVKIFNKKEILQYFSEKYPKIQEQTVDCHITKLTTNHNSRIHYSAKYTGEDDIFFRLPNGTLRLYKAGKDPAPIYKKKSLQPKDEIDADEVNIEETDSEQFVYEKDLQSYLSKNLHKIEPGLTLYEKDGVSGLEYPAGGRYIDILAVDSKNNLLVIELKVSRGYDRVTGQLLRYINWIKQHIAANGQNVRGAIITKEITQDLKLACTGLPDVSLYEYELSVSLRKVQ